MTQENRTLLQREKTVFFQLWYSENRLFAIFLFFLSIRYCTGLRSISTGTNLVHKNYNNKSNTTNNTKVFPIFYPHRSFQASTIENLHRTAIQKMIDGELSTSINNIICGIVSHLSIYGTL